MDLRCIIKNNKNIILFGILSTILTLLILPYHMGYDATWEYGMSHAIRNGWLPYNDFNTITTPLFFFFSSIGLFVWDQFLVYLLESILLYTIMFHFYQKAFPQNPFLLMIPMGLCFFFNYIPSYNSFSFILIVILMSLEKQNKSDRWIGLLLGLLILSKHTIGLGVLFFLLLYFLIHKKYKSLWTRLCFMMIPVMIFGIYLIVTNSVFSFFNLCVFGLFDFGEKNTLMNGITILSMGLFFLNICLIGKNKKNILLYYSLGSILFVIPIFDLSHFAYYFPIYMIPIIDQSFSSFSFRYFTGIIIGVLLLGNIVIRIPQYQNMKFVLGNHFRYTFINQDIWNRNQNLHQKLKEYPNYYLLTYDNMYHDIEYNRKITELNVPLYGNFGYDGLNKMKKKLQRCRGCYFVYDEDNYLTIKNRNGSKHFIYELVDAIHETCEKVDAWEEFRICYQK